MKKLPLLAMMLLFFPLAAYAGKKSDTVSVEINTNRGPARITLVRQGGGFVGPRGEYYSTFPSKKTLAAVYGTSATSGSNSGPISGEIKVVVVRGGVDIRRNGRLYSQIRTRHSDVRGWKLIRDNSAIVIKSGVNREPGTVEMFDVRSGRLLAKIKATAIKDGKPAWAKNFAE